MIKYIGVSIKNRGPCICLNTIRVGNNNDPISILIKRIICKLMGPVILWKSLIEAVFFITFRGVGKFVVSSEGLCTCF